MQTTTNLPPLSKADLALLEDLMDASLDLPELAAKHGLTIPQALDRTTSPPIAAYLEAFDRFRLHRERARQDKALTTLHRNLTAAQKPSEQIRAASTLLRYSTQRTREPTRHRALPRTNTPSALPPSAHQPSAAPPPSAFALHHPLDSLATLDEIAAATGANAPIELPRPTSPKRPGAVSSRSLASLAGAPPPR